MPAQLLLGTRNPSRIEMVRAILRGTPVRVLTLGELGIREEIEEDGLTPAENAEKKARGYYALARIPTLAIDGGLRIDRLPEEKQPGAFVKRRSETGPDASEADLRHYYLQELAKVGGESPGMWYVSHALAVSEQQVIVESYQFAVGFTTRTQGDPPPGRLFDPLMIDPPSGRYYTEIALEERPYFQANVDFLLGHIHLL